MPNQSPTLLEPRSTLFDGRDFPRDEGLNPVFYSLKRVTLPPQKAGKFRISSTKRINFRFGDKFNDIPEGFLGEVKNGLHPAPKYVFMHREFDLLEPGGNEPS